MQKLEQDIRVEMIKNISMMSFKKLNCVYKFKINMSTFLQTLDVFDKFSDDELRVQTKTGACISMAFLFFSFLVLGIEMFNYLRPSLNRYLNVDPNLTNNRDLLNISINIIVDLPCFFLHLDVLDSLGASRYYVQDTVKFKRLALINPSSSLPTTMSSYRFLGINNKSAKDVCFSCYDVAKFLPEGENSCCNSCDKLIQLYKQFGLRSEPQNWDQCKAGKYSHDISLDEKCQIKGKILVNKISGSFHICPGINNKNLMKYGYGDHIHNLDFDFPENGLNSTHQIISIRFGSKKIPMTTNSHENSDDMFIENVGTNIDSGKNTKQAMIYRYDLVSTPAILLSNSRSNHIKAYGYDTTFVNFKYPMEKFEQSPGIFFYYKFTPYTVVISKDPSQESGSVQVLSSTLGFLVGSFVLAEIIDSIFLRIEDFRIKTSLTLEEEPKER